VVVAVSKVYASWWLRRCGFTRLTRN